MESSPRHRIVRPPRLTTLVLLTLTANALIVGFVYRHHQHQVVASEGQLQLSLREVETQIEGTKEEIRRLEGVPTWEETQFASSTAR